MEIEVVRTADNRSETLWMLLAVILVLLVCGLVINQRRRVDGMPELTDTQISAFDDFNTMEQGTYNDLLTAVEEIMYAYELSEAWPVVDVLAESYIPPFVKDAAWQARGSLDWQLRVVETAGVEPPAGGESPAEEEEALCAYWGKSSEPDVSGNFLLLIHSGHEEESPEIWYTRRSVDAPPEALTDDALIIAGWLEVVPYKGEDELKRLKG